MKLLHANPKIISKEGFLTDSEVKNLIELASKDEKDSSVIDGQNGSVKSSSYRVCKVSYLDKAEDPIFQSLRDRIANAAGVRPCQLEGIQVLRYELGGHYYPHVDPVDTKNLGYDKFVSTGGQRIISFLIGLKEAEEGGSTEFHRISLSHKLKPGELMMFWSLNADGTINHLSEHSAMPVLKGEKIVVVGWIRERNFNGSEEVEKRSEEELIYELDQATKKRELDCFRRIEAVLRECNCTLENSSYPTVHRVTGVIHINKEIRVKSR
jgi:prolyl 4-hydroxylase